MFLTLEKYGNTRTAFFFSYFDVEVISQKPSELGSYGYHIFSISGTGNVEFINILTILQIDLKNKAHVILKF